MSLIRNIADPNIQVCPDHFFDSCLGQAAAVLKDIGCFSGHGRILSADGPVSVFIDISIV